MQTLTQLLGKILHHTKKFKEAGKNPGVLYLTPEDEEALQVHLWQQSLSLSLSLSGSTAPDVRELLPSGHLFAGMYIRWGSPTGETLVRAMTAAELCIIAKLRPSSPFTVEMEAQAAAEKPLPAGLNPRIRCWLYAPLGSGSPETQEIPAVAAGARAAYALGFSSEQRFQRGFPYRVLCRGTEMDKDQAAAACKVPPSADQEWYNIELPELLSQVRQPVVCTDDAGNPTFMASWAELETLLDAVRDASSSSTRYSHVLFCADSST